MKGRLWGTKIKILGFPRMMFPVTFLFKRKVSGIRSIDLALRWERGDLLFLRSSRVLKAVTTEEDLQVQQMSLAPAPATMFDPNQSDKRRIRRGSDPIHNRC
ncbi:hypothetical protein M9H77_04999 [Catharanthus roseus]|uniref:Uncharacterized protein n=1 Tax=Catharanthus roseus TaxID=4058 RepID=A0ACC0CG87_CATRO|nr:hypothetical protein M9H77_04999 [Catharanthus roseus]